METHGVCLDEQNALSAATLQCCQRLTWRWRCCRGCWRCFYVARSLGALQLAPLLSPSLAQYDMPQRCRWEAFMVSVMLAGTNAKLG